ncbi:hypothetical protein [Mongoliimonas terrestris]|uniref:hypothetical protein n=1 Tax=Mongoliimonas terrestris TaxID=1709001 RepID=UPI00111541B3|nr:hypothetical protein [Mongoliimonas terrestris]
MPVPTDLGRPEHYFFSFCHHGETFAIRVSGYSFADAQARFAAMSNAERRALSVGRLTPRDPDHLRFVGEWIRGRMRRAAQLVG